jgi:hypothetical protein
VGICGFFCRTLLRLDAWWRINTGLKTLWGTRGRGFKSRRSDQPSLAKRGKAIAPKGEGGPAAASGGSATNFSKQHWSAFTYGAHHYLQTSGNYLKNSFRHGKQIGFLS